MKIKKILLLLIALMFPCFLTGCSSTNAYCGTYSSIFVDSQNDEGNISFTLTINSDKTFELSRTPNSLTYKGTWKSYTDNNSNKTQLICYEKEGYKFNDYHPDAWSPYFTLTMLDDGTLMAAAGSTSSSYLITAFGSGGITAITLVIFEKN